jgi:maltose O-acetyltransferase
MPTPDAPQDWFPRELPANFHMAERSWLYSSFAFLHCEAHSSAAVTVGRDSGVYHGTFFDLTGQASVVIGDFCTLVGVIFATSGRITIGNYVFISHEVVLAESQFASPPRTIITSAPSDQHEIVIEDDVWIGAQAIIAGSVRIGRGAIVGAAALVDRDVPAYSIFAGNPGRVVSMASPPDATT